MTMVAEFRHIRAIIDMGGIPVIIALLRSKRDDVPKEAIHALSPIVLSFTECRTAILAGSLEPLLALCSREAMQYDVAYLLHMLCRDKSQPDLARVQPTLAVLARLLDVIDGRALLEACYALAYLTQSDGDQTSQKQRFQAVLQSGVMPRVIDLLSHEDWAVRFESVRIIGSLCAGGEVEIAAVLRFDGVLERLCALLDDTNGLVLKKACLLIAKITGGKPSHIELDPNATIISRLLLSLRIDDKECYTQQEATCAISNIFRGCTDAQIRCLVNRDILLPLRGVITYQEARVIEATMHCLEKVLRDCTPQATTDPQVTGLLSSITAHLSPAVDRLKSEYRQANVSGDRSRKEWLKQILGARITHTARE